MPVLSTGPRPPQVSGQPRDLRGRYATIHRGVVGFKYDPSARQHYKAWWPGERYVASPGWHVRLDGPGALYVPCGRVVAPRITRRGIALGAAAMGDAILAYAAAGWLCRALSWALPPQLDTFTLAILLYFAGIAWWGFARLVVRLCPAPFSPRDTFETLDERRLRLDREKQRRDSEDPSSDETPSP